MRRIGDESHKNPKSNETRRASSECQAKSRERAERTHLNMDPQSMAFQPQSQGDGWRIQNELNRLQAVQQDHAERLMQLERKNDDDVRMKSVWGVASPFPSVLTGTPQQSRQEKIIIA